MRAKLHGASWKKGNFVSETTGQLVEFDNVVFHVSYPNANTDGFGECIADIKIKRELIEAVYNRKELLEMVGHTCYFDSVPRGKGTAYIGIELIK